MPYSPLFAELLTQLGEGAADFSGSHRIADAAAREGLHSGAVAAFASLGSGGKWKSNIERDAHSWLANLYNFHLHTYGFDLRVDDADTGDQIDIKLPVCSIHRMVHSIWAAGSMQRAISLIGPEGVGYLAEFWRRVEETSWGKSHPALRSCDTSRLLGLVFHVDGVEVGHAPDNITPP